jgi:hypothetical protein
MGVFERFKALVPSAGKSIPLKNNDDISKTIKDPKGLPKDNISSGLLLDSGYETKFEDHLPKIRSQEQRNRLYRIMSTDSSVAGALRMYTQMLKMANVYAESATPLIYDEKDESEGTPSDWNDKEAKRYHEFLKQNICDMDGSMDDVITGAADFLIHGFSLSVPVYKFRDGMKQTDVKRKSKYSDGLLGWQNFKHISVDSVKEWDGPRSEGYSSIKGFRQETRSGYQTYVPRDRYVHFRTSAKNDSPSGESILLGALETFEEKCRYKKLENTASERNLAGIPMIECPSQWLSKDASQDNKNVVSYLRKIGTSMHFNSQAYLLLPSDRDENGNKLVDVSLMTAGDNAKLDSLRNVIEALERLIAETLVAAWLKLGSSSGSYALSDDLTSLFMMTLKGWLDSIIDSLNRDAVCRLFEMNSEAFPDPKYYPKLTYTGLEKDKIADLVQALTNAVNGGLVTASSEIQSELLKRMGLPESEALRMFREQQKVVKDLQDVAVKQAKNPPAEGTSGSTAPKSGGNAVSDITKG